LALIARCPQTFAQGGARGGITYATSNEFYLHGQQHIAISGAFVREGFLFPRGGYHG
jgi:hypothetical protein